MLQQERHTYTQAEPHTDAASLRDASPPLPSLPHPTPSPPLSGCLSQRDASIAGVKRAEGESWVGAGAEAEKELVQQVQGPRLQPGSHDTDMSQAEGS